MIALEQASPTPARRRRLIPVSDAPFRLTLDRRPGAPPLYRQIYTSLRAAILAGALADDARLPPERELATALGVNRTTVMRAFGELAADGLVVGRPGWGTRVRAAPAGAGTPNGATNAALPREHVWLLGLPSIGHGRLGPDIAILRDIAAGHRHADMISFAEGTPGHDLIPVQAIRQSLDRALGGVGAAGLSYAPVEGLASLRCAIAGRLAVQGVKASPDEVMVVHGATQGIALLAQTLIEPGDAVVVEAPTYLGALQTFAGAGARLIGLPVDEQGLRVDALESVLARHRVLFIFVQPDLHNPTGATLSPARRERLLWLSRRHGVPIVEDQAYGELGHAPPASVPLKSADRSGLVITIGTISKTLAPGLRVGWVVAPAPLIGRLALARQFADLSGGTLAQLAISDMLTSGFYERHLASIRLAYGERCAAMLAAVGTTPSLQLSFRPHGGFYLLCRLRDGHSARLVAAAALRAGVAVLAGEPFYPPAERGREDGRDRLRLSFAGATPPAIAEGIARLAGVLDRLPPGTAADPSLRSLQPLV